GGAGGGDRAGERGGVAAVVPRGGAPAFHLERGAGRERAAAAGAADSGLDGVDAEASGEVGTDGADVGDDDGGVGVGVQAADGLQRGVDREQLLLNHAAGGPADVNLFVAGGVGPVDGVDGDALGGAHGVVLAALEAAEGVAGADAEAGGLEAEVGGGGAGEDGGGGRGDIDAGERGVEGEGHRDAVGAE